MRGANMAAEPVSNIFIGKGQRERAAAAATAVAGKKGTKSTYPQQCLTCMMKYEMLFLKLPKILNFGGSQCAANHPGLHASLPFCSGTGRYVAARCCCCQCQCQCHVKLEPRKGLLAVPEPVRGTASVTRGMSHRLVRR